MSSLLFYFCALCIVCTSALNFTLQRTMLLKNIYRTVDEFFAPKINAIQNIGSKPLTLPSNIFQQLCYHFASLIKVPNDKSPDIRNIHFHYITPCFTHRVPVIHAEVLWRNSEFQKNRKLVILAYGWHTVTDNSTIIGEISNAFMCRPDVNFLAVDVSGYVNTFYAWAALNTDLIGKHIAIGLKELIEVAPSVDIHLIGHSLGAHVMGSAGREFHRLTNRLLPRITGLDPAKPCFINKTNLHPLGRGSADLVDIIHTNPGLLGQNLAIGDVDFYPEALDSFKPGCLTLRCSHNRAFNYFAESAYPGQENNFVGIKCTSMKELESKNCNSSTTSSMGYVIDPNARGLYYVAVNGESPFGKNADRTKTINLATGSDHCKCGAFSD